jgi:hypothetical protein
MSALGGIGRLDAASIRTSLFNAILGILAAFVTYGRFVLEPF